MSETLAQPPLPTPGRRRQGRQQNRNTAQKAYMSENDAGVVEVPPHQIGTPQTPNKTAYASPATHTSNRATNGKQRNKPKSNNKQKNGASTSPEPENHHNAHHNQHHQKQQSTPQRASSAGIKGPSLAFAGATFHASPAPSALPMPSFFNRGSTSPSAATRDTAPVAQQPSPPGTDTEGPTPYRSPPSTDVKESPLDFMFRAHRQERERQRSDSDNAEHAASTPPAFSPFAAIAKATSSSQNRPGPVRRTSHGISSEELDGMGGQPTGPAFSTPYHDRIKAAKGNPNHSSPAAGSQFQPREPQPPHPMQSAQSEDPTDALKKFLFGGNSRAANNPAQEFAAPRPTMYGVGAPSPARADYQPNGYFGHHPPPQQNNIQAMENDLRRILKIDQGMQSSPVERRLFTK